MHRPLGPWLLHTTFFPERNGHINIFFVNIYFYFFKSLMTDFCSGINGHSLIYERPFFFYETFKLNFLIISRRIIVCSTQHSLTIHLSCFAVVHRLRQRPIKFATVLNFTDFVQIFRIALLDISYFGNCA